MRLRKLALTMMAMMVTNQAFAVTSGEINPAISYEIGGYSKQNSRQNHSVPFSAALKWGKNGFCGAFDQSLSVSNILNNLSGKAKKLESDLVKTATGVISNGLWIELARLDPTLYEVLQQGKLDALEEFGLSIASCEQAAEDLATGGGADDWIQMSSKNDWFAKDHGGDAVKAKENIEKNMGNSGIKWLDGKNRGGSGQPPIEVEKDIVLAGYNLLSGRTPTNTSSADDTGPSYTKFWKTPSEAQEWITDIIGTTEIATCTSCQKKKTKPGKGVYGYLERLQVEYQHKLEKLITSSRSNFTAEELEAVSSPGMVITQQIIEALRLETLYQKPLTEKLAEEIATNDVIERLIAARQILIAGKREANVSESKQAIDIIDDRISLINDEMKLIHQDIELRNAAKNSVGVIILDRQEKRKAKTYKAGSNAIDQGRNTIKAITGTQ